MLVKGWLRLRPVSAMSDIDPKIVRHLRDAQPDLYWLDSDPLEPLPHSALVGEVHADLLIV